MPVDLIAYALVALFLFVMLYRVLGTRQDGDFIRPNPFVTPPPAANADKTEVRVDATLVNAPATPAGNASADVQQSLFQMALIDKSFDANQFVANAKEAYRIVVESFAAGDRGTLRDLLAGDVLPAFEQALDERVKSGETMDAEIRAITGADIIAATLDTNNVARITLRFTSSQIRVTRDASGAVVDGDADRPSGLVDVWSFARTLRTNDPRWLVVETEDGDDSDGPL